MTHSKVSLADKLKAGISDELIRISIGIEDVQDIINDLKQGLETV
jgi:cystathionine beta-lyase/cystathionine gamma-synthase